MDTVSIAVRGALFSKGNATQAVQMRLNQITFSCQVLHKSALLNALLSISIACASLTVEIKLLRENARTCATLVSHFTTSLQERARRRVAALF